jgi:hypothetical protein
VSANNSSNKSVTLECSGTKSVLGGGGIVNNDNPALNDSYASADNAWTVTANEQGFGTGSNWTLTVWAICGDVG